MNRIGNIQLLIQEYRSKINANDSDLANDILNSYEQLLQEFKQQNDMINQIWDVLESEKLELAQQTLDPLEQILYSSLLGVRSLEAEAQSDSAKNYLQTLKTEIEGQLKSLKQTSISVYPICMQDLGPFDAAKSFYEISKAAGRLEVDVQFHGDMKRYTQKVETLLYRTIQYFLKTVDTNKAIQAVSISVKEKRGQVILVFEGNKLMDQLQQMEHYNVLERLITNLDGIDIAHKKQQLHIIASV